MSRVQVNLNLPGLNKLMTSAPVQAAADDLGAKLAGRAGENFEYVSKPHRYTARGYVQPANGLGAREQARNAVLERALGAK